MLGHSKPMARKPNFGLGLGPTQAYLLLTRLGSGNGQKLYNDGIKSRANTYLPQWRGKNALKIKN